MVKKRLAVLVLNYNGKKFLTACFNSLRQQTSGDFDVFLIDNGSSDDSVVFTRTNFRKIRILRLKTNGGYVGAYNYAFEVLEKRRTRYEYYLLLNNDTVSDKRMIEEIIKTFQLSDNIGMVVPAIVRENFIIDSCGSKLLFPTVTPSGNLHGQKYHRLNKRYSCFWGSGCALAIRRSLLKKIGYFENYFGYFEDIYLCWRAINSHYMVAATLGSYVVHSGGRTYPSLQQSYLCEKNRIICCWQNLSLPFFLITLPPLLLSRLFLLTRSLSFKQALVKVQGILSGMLALRKFKRCGQSLKQDLINLRLMHEVTKI